VLGVFDLIENTMAVDGKPSRLVSGDVTAEDEHGHALREKIVMRQDF
tara:strand:- start:65 stop:205 length:141 start_codon:yes stop_codon:yes gene_type:complete